MHMICWMPNAALFASGRTLTIHSTLISMFHFLSGSTVKCLAHSALRICCSLCVGPLLVPRTCKGESKVLRSMRCGVQTSPVLACRGYTDGQLAVRGSVGNACSIKATAASLQQFGLQSCYIYGGTACESCKEAHAPFHNHWQSHVQCLLYCPL